MVESPSSFLLKVHHLIFKIYLTVLVEVHFLFWTRDAYCNIASLLSMLVSIIEFNNMIMSVYISFAQLPLMILSPGLPCYPYTTVSVAPAASSPLSTSCVPMLSPHNYLFSLFLWSWF